MSQALETLAAYHLAYDDDGTIVDDRTAAPFDRERYSRMKYGDKVATKFFAAKVADELTERVPEFIESDIPPEFLVAYKAIPPACHYLSRYCLDLINLQRLERGNEPGRIIHVYKNRVAGTDYAAASPEARQKELDGIGFSLEGRELTGKPVAVLDDIKITGAAERKILEVIAPEHPAVVALGYVAIFNAAQANVSPHVERDLNLSVIKSPLDLLPAIANGNFDLNIRTLKMILGTDAATRQAFLASVPHEVLEQIVRGSVDTGPGFVATYARAVNEILIVHKERNGS